MNCEAAFAEFHQVCHEVSQDFLGSDTCHHFFDFFGDMLSARGTGKVVLIISSCHFYEARGFMANAVKLK